MKTLILGNWTTWCLSIVCVLLVLVVTAEYESDNDAKVMTEPATGSAALTQQESGLEIDANRSQPDDIKVILDRPLFTKGRLPFKKTDSRTDSLTNSRPLRLSLEGVAIRSEKRIALIKDLQTNARTQLTEGSEYKGWTVEKVDTTSIIIKKGSRSLRLNLTP